MIVGFIAILFMGITLGLLGAGGSILTVPILVYLFEINPILSTSYSLLLVGFIALFGNFFYFKKQQVDFNIAIKFAMKQKGINKKKSKTRKKGTTQQFSKRKVIKK